MNRRLLTGTGLIAATVLFVAINVLALTSLRHVRLDLTQNRLFTLSPGSKNILKNLAEPIVLRFFFSDKLANELPQFRVYGGRVKELLEEYAAWSNGKIKLEIVDPEPFSDAEDRAVQAGVRALPLDRAGRAFYFGLAGANSVDDQQVIAFFQAEQEQFLEYDLTRLIYALTSPKKPKIAVIGVLPLDFGPGGMMAAMRGQSQPYAIMTQLRQTFDIKTFDNATAAIDADIDVLMLAHPRDLSKTALYAIDQFVLRGGRIVAFVDPYSESMAAMPPMMGAPSPPGGDQGSNIPELLAAWGVGMTEGEFVADLALAQRVQTGQGGPRQVVDYLPWLNIGQAQLNRDDIVSADLGQLNLASAGALKPTAGATTSFTPLITSSDKAMLVSVDKIKGRPDPEGLLAAFAATGERYVLAARLAGPIKTAFPDGPPPAQPNPDNPTAAGADKPAIHLRDSIKPANIVIVADSDLLDDRFWVRGQELFGQRISVPFASNGDLAVNVVDHLSGTTDLISLRGRGRSQRPFELIEAMRRDAEQKFLARERSLQQRLEATEKQIADVQQKKPAGAAASVLLSAEERAALEGFRDELVRTRRELRAVQRDLNKDIEALEAGVKFVNIGLMPIAVGCLGLFSALLRRARRRAPKV